MHKFSAADDLRGPDDDVTLLLLRNFVRSTQLGLGQTPQHIDNQPRSLLALAPAAASGTSRKK